MCVYCFLVFFVLFVVLIFVYLNGVIVDKTSLIVAFHITNGPLKPPIWVEASNKIAISSVVSFICTILFAPYAYR